MLQEALEARVELAQSWFCQLHEGAAYDGGGITRASYGDGDGERWAHVLMARAACQLGLEIEAGHAMTKIAGQVDFSLDMRSLDGGLLNELEGRLVEMTGAMERRPQVRFALGAFTRAAPGSLDADSKRALRAGIDEPGMQALDITSGASHGAAAFAAAGVPTAMLVHPPCQRRPRSG